MAEQRLWAGTATVDITPPLGIAVPGSFSARTVRTIHDPLQASALVLRNNETAVAFVSCDLVAVETETVRAIRNLASETSAIPSEQIHISATHTHAGAQVVSAFYDVGGIDPHYLEILTRQIASAIILAAERVQEARIGFGRGHEPNLVFNRRLAGMDGRVFMNFSISKAQAPQMGLRTLGPVDPTVDVMRVDSAAGKPLAVFVNYGLHNAVVGGDFISAGFPAAMRSLLRKALGDITVLFSEGPCGNVNHINIENSSQLTGHQEAARIGTVLAGEVLKVWANVRTTPELEIRTTSSLLMIPERPVGGPVDDGLHAFGNDNETIRAQYARERTAILVRPIEQVPVEVAVVAMNDAIMLTNPSELFVEFGLAMRQKSPFHYTFPLTLTNGYVGYVCTRQAFVEGGYEPRRTVFSSRLAIDAGDTILQESLRLMAVLKDEPQKL
jgi:neutral ceramidase